MNGISLIRRFFALAAFFLGMTVIWDTTLASNRFVTIYFPDGDSVSVELAVTQEERAQGLMFRKKLGFDEGMLFVFSEENFYSFWMKNMIIPLDFIWLDKDRRIVHMEQNVPPCKQDPCPSYTSKVPAMFFLELKAGSVEKRKLMMFERLDFVLPCSHPNLGSDKLNCLADFEIDDVGGRFFSQLVL